MGLGLCVSGSVHIGRPTTINENNGIIDLLGPYYVKNEHLIFTVT